MVGSNEQHDEKSSLQEYRNTIGRDHVTRLRACAIRWDATHGETRDSFGAQTKLIKHHYYSRTSHIGSANVVYRREHCGSSVHTSEIIVRIRRLGEKAVLLGRETKSSNLQ
jgi:hypothetical protein